jgi:hypothetical protein
MYTRKAAIAVVLSVVAAAPRRGAAAKIPARPLSSYRMGLRVDGAFVGVLDQSQVLITPSDGSERRVNLPRPPLNLPVWRWEKVLEPSAPIVNAAFTLGDDVNYGAAPDELYDIVVVDGYLVLLLAIRLGDAYLVRMRLADQRLETRLFTRSRPYRRYMFALPSNDIVVVEDGDIRTIVPWVDL